MSPTPVRLSLVGCGGISEAHIAGYKDLWSRGCRSFLVTAVCDPNRAAAEQRAAQIAAFQGSAPTIFTDQRALADARIADAADVCVPHCFHHTAAIPLLEAGLHVLLEKPLGITIRAGRAIIAAAERAKRVLATAENVRRYLGARAAAWAIKEAKLIGEPIAGTATFFIRQPLPLDEPKFRWRALKLLTGGGMIIDSGAHFTDMMLHLFGEVTTVSCAMRALDRREVLDVPAIGKGRVDVETWWHADIRFASGMQVAWSFCNTFHGKGRCEAAYYGSDGTIVDGSFPFHPFQNGGALTTADGREMSREQLQEAYLATLDGATRDRLFPHGSTDGFAVQVWDFIDAIANSRAPEMDGLAGQRAKALCEACYESATLSRPVTFDEVLSGRVDAYQRPIDEQWKLMPSSAAAAAAR